VSGRVRLPADVELEDKLAFGLSARQLLLLGLTAILSYGLFTLASAKLPLPAAAALAAPLTFAGALLALGRRDGLSADRLALAALRFLSQPRWRVLAPEGIPARPNGLPARRPLAPLELPVRAVLRSGLVELTDGSFCLLLRAASASFALRSEEEQQALVEAFGRFLNGIAEPIEIVIRSEPVDLKARADDLEHAARELAQPALREAACGYARFLAELGADEEVRRREILLLLSTRARGRTAAQTALRRRAAEAIELLQTAAVELQPLEGEQAATLLARALDPPGPPTGARLDTVVTAC
jgi:hypothetical protein